MAGPSKSLVAAYGVVGGFALLVLAVQTATSDDAAAEPRGATPTATATAEEKPVAATSEVVNPEAPVAIATETLRPHGDVASLIGVSSCAASGCHGGVAVNDGFVVMQPETWRSSYVIWASHKDPHREAYRDLYSPLADDIVRKLAQREPVEPGMQGDWLKAYEDRRCLSCHATVDFDKLPLPATIVDGKTDSHSHRAPDEWLKSPLLADGVGCESCHGPAKSWVGEHFLIPEAYRTDPRMQADEKRRLTGLGMVDTDQLSLQAEACTGCHIGKRDGKDVRDMNHDMIAAGHPALYFDFAGYKARLPRHWREPQATEERANRVHEAWSAGKLAAAAAQLKLSAARYDDSYGNVPGAVWPEFSEYDCYACHHRLRSAVDDRVTLRQQAAEKRAAAAPGPIGKQVWGSWASWHLNQAASVPGFPGDQWKEITSQLQTPFASRAEMVARMQAARELAASLAASPGAAAAAGGLRTADDYRKELQSVAEAASRDAVGWEDSVQRYLRCVAIYRAWRIASGMPTERADDPLATALMELYETLKFPSDKQRPFQSPAQFNPTAVAEGFGKVATAMEN